MKHLFRYIAAIVAVLALMCGAAYGGMWFSTDHAEATPSPATQTTLPALSNNPNYDPKQGPVPDGVVSLSFDDCQFDPALMKRTILSAEQQDIGMVMAFTGACVQYYKYGQNDAELKDIVGYARKHRQYVIGHSNTHPHMVAVGKQPAMDIDNVRAEVSIDGLVSNYYRPPFGELDGNILKALAQMNIRPWLWGDDLDTNDWKGKSQTQIVDFVTNNATPKGGTFLMHLSHPGFTPEALQQMKTGLTAKGIKVCKAYPGGTTPSILPDQLPC